MPFAGDAVEDDACNGHIVAIFHASERHSGRGFGLTRHVDDENDGPTKHRRDVRGGA